MKEGEEKLKQDIAKQISETNNPIIKRALEKRLKEIDKPVQK